MESDIFNLIVTISAVYGAVAVAGFSAQEDDVHKLIMGEVATVMALAIIAAVGTDLAEALILPTVVVMVAEALAFSELLAEKEKRRIGIEKLPPTRGGDIGLEILETSPILVCGVLIVYGAILTGFQGGAVAGVGVVYYLIGKWEGDISPELWDVTSSLGGIGWCWWILGFALIYLLPEYWLLGLFMAATGILVKVTSKMQLLGVETKRTIKERIMEGE